MELLFREGSAALERMKQAFIQMRLGESCTNGERVLRCHIEDVVTEFQATRHRVGDHSPYKGKDARSSTVIRYCYAKRFMLSPSTWNENHRARREKKTYGSIGDPV